MTLLSCTFFQNSVGFYDSLGLWKYCRHCPAERDRDFCRCVDIIYQMNVLDRQLPGRTSFSEESIERSEEAPRSGFEIQRRRHQKSKTGNLCPSRDLIEKIPFFARRN